MRNHIDWIDTPPGHIVITLVLLVVGVVMQIFHLPYGSEIGAGALASLYTASRLTPPGGPPGAVEA
jgi:hypothetical protein